MDKIVTAPAAICGDNPVLPAARVGCGERIDFCKDVYRCTDCGVPFHRDCARRHFTDDVKPEDVGVPALEELG